MKRVALFAHYDGQAEVRPYVSFFLRALKEVCAEIRFVSTALLSDAELDRVRPYCSSVVSLIENRGYDFGMWQHELGSLELTGVDELILTNSSFFGPICPLAPILDQMGRAECDFWGMTDTFEIDWHLQSYFLVFKQAALSSSAFATFFKSVLPYKNKEQLIRSYELGLSRFLIEQGLRAAAFIPVGAWLSSPEARTKLARRRRNPTLFQPLALIAAGMPFVKVQLLRDNPLGVPLGPVLRAMRESGYDMSNVRFDRASASPKTFAERVRRWLHPPFVEGQLKKTRSKG